MIQTRDYLVNYGKSGFLGRFRSANAYARDDRVVIRSPRGDELGSILGDVATNLAGPPLEGNVLREATSQDLESIEQLRELATRIVGEAQQLAEQMDLPILVLDGEILLDPREAILQTVHWAECDATPLFEELSQRHGFLVKVADLTSRAKPAKACATCGEEKSGCDSCGSSGGCSSGSCSSGSVKSADELTAYFSGLRRQMEAADARVSLH